MNIPVDYSERVYAGVLGKIIGVYLGRPFEGWTYEKIMQNLGEINYYVHEKLNVPLVVTDDDITGTFTFLRALPDYGNSLSLTPAQIGQSWLNYIIENRTILWWGGLGNSTEHTAFLRLKSGIQAPHSGSMALNSKVVAEQIGSQIFIDGWAMVSPGDPAQAADLARRAASVSHDGEAIYGAQVLAAMEAQAFVEPDLNRLLDVGVSFIPKDSVIYRLIGDIRNWHASLPDWRAAREKIQSNYGYDQYGGNCHMVPNHALIMLAMLYGGDDFQKTLMIANTSGWDTDCNSGNVGCLFGLKNGLASLETGPDYRGPLADRIYLPTAEGGSAMNDALTQAYKIVNIGRALAGQPALAPKNGARFHFSLPGSVQGFMEEQSAACKDILKIENAPLPGSGDQRCLALRYQDIATGREARAATATFLPQEFAHSVEHYELLASPSLYTGQTVQARLLADASNAQPVTAGLYVRYYGPEDTLVLLRGPVAAFQPGQCQELSWLMPDLDGQPLAEVGVEISSARRASGSLYVDYLTWSGEPNVRLGRPAAGGSLWRKAWVNAVDSYDPRWPEAYRLVQNSGTGLISQGTLDWRNYSVEAAVSIHIADAAGIAARVQGLERYYALLLCAGNKVRLVKKLDGSRTLAEKDFAFEWDQEVSLKFTVSGTRLQAWADGQALFDLQDTDRPLQSGAVALLIEAGRFACEEVRVTPIQ